MNIRPRCREWLPLSTQQLRLRNLQAIQGVNIELDANSSYLPSNSVYTQTLLYYTLHDHPENEPFYQSEKLALRKHLHMKWAEIQCPEILKSNANCVCIKIWTCVKKTENLENINNDKLIEVASYADENQTNKLLTENIKEPMSVLTREITKFQKLPHPSDILLFKWAVYFSGLIPLSQNTEVKCRPNSLIFQMNDEYFASPDLFTTEYLRGQLALNYERYSASVPKSSIPTPDEFAINSPQVSRSSSPVTVDCQRDLLRMSKTRYVQLNCIRSEVRPSYDLTKLLRLQQLQRQHLQIQRECVEMTADIKQLSLRCITKEQLLRKSRTTSINSSSASTSTALQHHSMGRTLSLLLFEQQQIDPNQLLKAQKLQEQVETFKSKERLLKSAQETFFKRISDLRQQLNAATTSRQQVQTWLSLQQKRLTDDKKSLERLIIEKSERKRRRDSLTQHVKRIMSSLCLELRDIYPIARNRRGIYTICGVPFPTMHHCVLGSLNTQSSANISENITPMALSASLGYVAHLIEMISVVLNRPLRYPIIYEGSRTRIVDVIKDFPLYTSRELPLYSRSSIPTKPVKYAINLLNENIAQLCFDITGISCDMCATIDNLLNIFATLVQIEQNKGELHTNKPFFTSNPLTSNTEINNADDIDGPRHHDMHIHQDYHDDSQKVLHLPNQVSTKNGEQDNSLAKSHSSVDINHLSPPTTITHHLHHNVSVFSLKSDKLLHTSRLRAHPIEVQDCSALLIATNQQRNCRSVGSFTDSEEEVCRSTPTKYFSNSESNLTSSHTYDSHHNI